MRQGAVVDRGQRVQLLARLQLAIGIGQGQQAALLIQQGQGFGAFRRQGAGQARQAAQIDIMANHEAAAVIGGPAGGHGQANLARGVKGIGLGPDNGPVIVTGHGIAEPGALPGIVILLPCFAADQPPLTVPEKPVGGASPVCRVADAIGPAAVGIMQQQDFAPGLMCHVDRGYLGVVFDDGEKEIVEALQFVTIGRQPFGLAVPGAVAAPGLAGAQGVLHAGEQMLGAGLQLLGGNLHFRLCQAVDGALHDQVIAAKGKYQNGQQNQSAHAQDQTAGESLFQSALQYRRTVLCCDEGRSVCRRGCARSERWSWRFP